MTRISIDLLLLLIAGVTANVEDDNEGNLDSNSVDLSSSEASGDGNFNSGGDTSFRAEELLALKSNTSSRSSTTSKVDDKSRVGGTGTGYGFYRSMGPHGRWEDTRRVFGGAAARLEDFPGICALLDRFMAARCSGAVLTDYWILTAAHCISPALAYVKFNTRTPLRTHEGEIIAIRFLYKHPDYKVVQEDLGRGLDVTVLHHDVGLVRTRGPMKLALRSHVPQLRELSTFNAQELRNENVQVLGYGRTEATSQGEELLGVRLRLVSCDRDAWQFCVCGVAPSPESSSGVCSGDSGGPVVFKGVQVGVTSMGPLECSSANSTWPVRATSVFTAVHPYTDIINRTIHDAEHSMTKYEFTNSMSNALVPKAIPTTAAIVLFPLLL